VNFNPQNAYRNGTMYSSYKAASFAQLYKLAAKYHANLQGAVSWSFEFEDEPWFAGFRDLATNGVDKPVLNVFRMFGMMKGNMLEVNNTTALSLQNIVDSSVRGSQSYVDAMATADAHNIYIMLWNYHDDDSRKNNIDINLLLQNIHADKAAISEYRIDENNSNSYTVWKKMGSPQQVSSDQFTQLEKAGQLKMITSSAPLKVANENINYQLTLPSQAVVLLKVSW
ncbi:MAG: beta-xylosidase, partial [Panacibacter sp.]